MAHVPGVVASVNVSDAVPHASDPVGVLNTGVAGQATLPLEPTPVITGGVLSVTVIACEAVTELLQPSATVHVLVTV